MPLPLEIVIGTFARLILGGIVVLYIWPRYAFGPVPEASRSDAAVGYAARMLLALIVAGYALAATHLYSWLTLVLALAALAFLRDRTERSQYELGRGRRFAASLLTELDRLGSWPTRLRESRQAPRRRRAGARPRIHAVELAGAALLLVVLGVSAYLRLASPLQHAGIPFSDSDVVLYWVQSIEQQVLFPSGIYPEGFHIVIADLMRLTAANPIATVKFFGPLVGVAMVASVAYATYRLTGRIGPAVVAVLVYGTLPHFLPYEHLRQVGTDSQEFGNMLVLPTLWFVYASWQNGSRFYRGTAVSLLAVAGLTHPVVALNAGIAAVAGTLAAWLAHGVDWRALGWYVRWTALAVLIAVVPLGMALALGIHLNSSGAAFAGAVSHAPAPLIGLPERVALVAAFALLAVRAVRLIAGRSGRAELGAPLAGLLLLLGALAVQEAPLLGIHSVVLASRSGELVALGEVLAYGMGLSAVQEIFELLHVPTARWLALAGAAALVALAWSQYRPVPWNAFATARWLPDDFVVAYADIGSSFQRGSWLAVSDDSGFDYAYGEGFFMRGEEFLSRVATTGTWPRYAVAGGAAAPVGESRIFIFVDRRLVVAKAYRHVVAPRRAKAQAAIRKWLAAWETTHGPLQIYFRGPDLTVYELSRGGPTTALDSQVR